MHGSCDNRVYVAIYASSVAGWYEINNFAKETSLILVVLQSFAATFFWTQSKMKAVFL